VVGLCTKKPPGKRAAICWLRPETESHQALGRIVVVVLQTILVANHLAVELIDEFIDGGIQVFVGALGKHVTAFDMDIAFGTLPSLLFLLLLNREEYLDIDHLVKMSHDSIKLGRDITTQGRGNFKMVTADR
jgi:hypothetical protein